MQQIAADLSAIQSRLEAQKQDDGAKDIKCGKCGVNNHFSPNQWRIRCICGQIITRSTKGREAVKGTHCRICDDTGVITYDAQYEEQVYTFAARCICAAGDKRTELAPVMYAENVPGWLMDRVQGKPQADENHPWSNSA